jgi:hypothetical protein
MRASPSAPAGTCASVSGSTIVTRTQPGHHSLRAPGEWPNTASRSELS